MYSLIGFGRERCFDMKHFYNNYTVVIFEAVYLRWLQCKISLDFVGSYLPSVLELFEYFFERQ